MKALYTIIIVLAAALVLLGMAKSPSSNESGLVGSRPGAPAHIISTMELQRELNRRNPKAKLEEDGICGPATQAEWDAQCNTQIAIELWPSDKGYRRTCSEHNK